MSRNKKKGFIAGIAIAFAVIGLLTSMLIFGAFLKFTSDNEKKLSDRVYFGLSSINYFYLTEKNINEFTQIVTEITAKELGEACGGFDCYSWSANNPSYTDLRDKFESELRGKITGFPAQIGNGGRLSFAPPEITGLEMDEEHVKISMFPQQVYRETKSFSVKATSGDDLEIDKQIRYLLLAKIGQQLYGNGTYVRDASRIWVNSGKFDCNGITKSINTRTRLSDANLNSCKILDINFDVDDASWNSYKTNCYNIMNSADPGFFAGKVEGGKIYVQIDSLLEKSLICGIDTTDGLASVTDTKGEVSKSSSSSQPTCTETEAGHNAWEKANMEGKINTILNALSNSIESGQTGIDVQTNAKIGSANSYTPENSQSGWTVSCGNRGDGSCGASCASTSQYCKSGDACVQQSSFSCKYSGSCSYSPCKSKSCTLYNAENNIGFCCPKEYPVFDSYTKTCFASSGDNLKIEAVNKNSPELSKQYCDDCTSWKNPPSGQPSTGSPSCSWSNSNYGTFCYWTSNYGCTYSGDQNSGSTSTSADYQWSGSSMCGMYSQTMSRQQEWGDGVFSESRHDHSASRGTSGSGDTYYSDTYSCYLGAYFKFTFTPDISFKIIDNTMKVVKKGTTTFEDLYFAVKFKPSSPYVIGG